MCFLSHPFTFGVADSQPTFRFQEDPFATLLAEDSYSSHTLRTRESSRLCDLVSLTPRLPSRKTLVHLNISYQDSSVHLLSLAYLETHQNQIMRRVACVIPRLHTHTSIKLLLCLSVINQFLPVLTILLNPE